MTPPDTLSLLRRRRDATYGGGRYLPVKGADLGATAAGEILLDFNFAYHPSCHYNAEWACPLAPPDNQVSGPDRSRGAGLRAED